MVEKILGLFSNFDALANVTQSIETITECPISNSTMNNIQEDFVEGLESLSTLLIENTPSDLTNEAIKELANNVAELSTTTGCLTESQASTIKVYIPDMFYSY